MAIQKELLEEIDGRCNCLAARKASRYLTAAYDQALAPADLRATQFSILHKLAKDGPLTMGDVAAAMAMDRTTLSSNLKPLERDGLVDMVPGQDRRVKMVTITNEGVVRYRTALPFWQAVQQEFERQYGEKRAVALRNSLRNVLNTGFRPWSDGEVATSKD